MGRTLATSRVALAVAVAATLLGGLAAAQDGVLVIRAEKVISVAGEPISPGAVLVRDGKIAAVGPTIEAPEGARVIDAADGVVIPGLVAALTTLSEGGRDTEESVTPELRVADGVDLFGDWRELLKGGVTTVYLSPPGRRAMPGQGAVARLSEGKPSATVLLDPASLRIVLGEWPKNPPDLWDPPLPPTPEHPVSPPEKQLPTTRMGTLALLRRVFSEAHGAGGERLSGLQLAAVKAALAGEVPVHVRADRAEDIRRALALADEFGLKLVIEGGNEAHQLADELARRGVPVIVTAPAWVGHQSIEDLTLADVRGETRPDLAAKLMAAGVKVALSTEDVSLPELLVIAASTAGQGAPEDTALRAVTADAAEILGVSDRVGTIEVGKDADLLILTGEPLATETQVAVTVSGGQVAWERGTQEDVETGPDGLRIIRARRIVTGTGEALDDGEIRVRGGVIESVGERTEPPAGAKVVDLGDRTVMPGMIDIQSRLGLHWESDTVTLSPGSPVSGSDATKLTSIANAIDPTDEAFGEALRAGVTSIALTAATSGLFCGSMAVVKTAGRGVDERLVEPVAALRFSMLGSQDRSARASQAREFLEKARKYDEDWTAFDRRWAEFERKYAANPEADLDEPSRPKRDAEMEMLRTIFREKTPVLVVADRPDEIAATLKVFREEFGLNTVAVGSQDADRVAGDLKAARIGVVLAPQIIVRDERGRETNRPAELAEAGVPVALATGGTSATQVLRLNAAYAVRKGMDRRDALRAITVRPAEFLGLERRLGSIEPGRDADLVVLSGDPLELTSRVEKVFVNGEVAYDAETEG